MVTCSGTNNITDVKIFAISEPMAVQMLLMVDDPKEGVRKGESKKKKKL